MRSASARLLPAEFPNLQTGRYLLLLFRNGRCTGARVFWHNEDVPTNEVLEESEGGCHVRIP